MLLLAAASMAVLTFQVSGRDRWATVGWALHETGLFLRIGFWVIASVFADAAIQQCSLELAAADLVGLTSISVESLRCRPQPYASWAYDVRAWLVGPAQFCLVGVTCVLRPWLRRLSAHVTGMEKFWFVPSLAAGAVSFWGGVLLVR